MNTNIITTTVRSILTQREFEAFGEIMPLVMQIAELNNPQTSHVKFEKTPLTLTNIMRVCRYLEGNRSRIKTVIESGFEEAGQLADIKVIPGIRRHRKCDIEFKDVSSFLFAFTFLRNRVATSFKLLQARITGVVLTKIAADLQRQLDQEKEQRLQLTEQINVERIQRLQLTEQIKVERISVSELICKHFRQTYKNCTQRKQICKTWHTRGWIRLSVSETGGCYKFNSLAGLNSAKAYLANFNEGQPKLTQYFR